MKEKCLIILLFTFKSSVLRGLTEKDSNTCLETISREYYCCSNYEKINDKCIKCKLGFLSRKGNSCEPCDYNYYGNSCSGTCMCKKSQRCDNVEGCVDRDTTSTLTITSDIAEIISSEESVTKVYEEEKDDGLSKTELLTLFCGALSGIIVILGFLGILNFVKKRACILKSKRDKPTEEEVHISEKPDMQEAFALHESFYETIDDSHLEIILVPQTVNPNPGIDDESQSSGSSEKLNDDRLSYLDAISSPITKKSCFRKEKQSKKIFPLARKSTCLQNQMACSPNLETDDKSSSSGSSTNCNNNQSIYIQPFDSLLTKEQSRINNVFRSANNSTCIADQTFYNPHVDIEEDDSDDSSIEFSEDATHDRSSYLHPYNALLNKTSSCHIYRMCQNEPFSE